MEPKQDATITVTTKIDWELVDATDGTSTKHKTIPAGTYELERIPNPLGLKIPWLVLKGTKIGKGEKAWKGWINGALNDDGNPIDWKEYEIVLYEDGQLVPPPTEYY